MIIFKTKTPAVKGRSCEGIAENKSENIENDAPSFQKHFNFACSARGEQRLVEEGKLCRGLLQNRDPAAASLMKRRQVARS